MLVFYFFAAIVISLGILSLRGGIRFAAYVRNEVSKPLADFTPRVSVFAPCRGLDDGLKQNLAALFQQDYPKYEIVFVTDRADDPSLGLIRELIEAGDESSKISTKIIIAGPASDSGQKVHNLCVAVSQGNARSEVFVFVDTDARPQPHWLRSLVAPLSDEKVGAASGYRWFVPVAGGLASHLRAVWNASIASALGASREQNFCWGGSTAIRRSTFEELRYDISGLLGLAGAEQFPMTSLLRWRCMRRNCQFISCRPAWFRRWIHARCASCSSLLTGN